MRCVGLLIALCLSGSALGQDCPGGRCPVPLRPQVTSVPQAAPPVTIVQPSLINFAPTVNLMPRSVVVSQAQPIAAPVAVRERRFRLFRCCR